MSNAKDFSFDIFPQLITELRLQIWESALPEPTNHALYLYQKGCWSTKHISPQDSGLTSTQNGNNGDLHLYFDTRKLDPLRIELPLGLVNHEAREVADKYIRSQNLISRPSDSGLEVVRYFDAERDTVLVPTNALDDLLNEPLERLFEPDLEGKNVDKLNPALPRLAVTLFGLKTLGDPLEALFDAFGDIPVLYVVEIADSEAVSQKRLEFENDGSNKLVWNGSEREWHVVGSRIAVLEQMKALLPKLGDEHASRKFEIRLVKLVNR